jgi:septal ring factor EnvC (AmiA/AmiB activator)
MAFEGTVDLLGAQRLKLEVEVKKLEQLAVQINEEGKRIQTRIERHNARIAEINQAIQLLGS